MQDDIMFQEAVFNCIDAIDEATLFSEYEVLHSLGETYIKSALIMEAAVDSNPAADPTDLPEGPKGRDQEGWFKGAIGWIIRGLRWLGGKIKEFAKKIAKAFRGFVTKVKNLRPGVTIYSDNDNRERIKVTASKDGTPEKVEVILDYDVNAAYKEMVNFADADKGHAQAKAPKFIKKKTIVDQKFYDNMLSEFLDAIHGAIKKMEEAQKFFEGKSEANKKEWSDSVANLNARMKWVSELSATVNQNNVGIHEAYQKLLVGETTKAIKNKVKFEIADADEKTMSRKEMKQVRDVL